MRRLLHDYALSIALAVLFTASWALQTWTGWVEFAAQQHQDGHPAEVFGLQGYIWSWAQATFENWQSEFLQVFVFIVLTAFLVHRHSHESPDTDHATEASLRRIEAHLHALDERLGQR